jgi:hypothetical protein
MRTLLTPLLLLSAVPLAAEPRVRHAFSSSAAIGGARRVVVVIPTGDVTLRNGPVGQLSVSGYASREPDGPRSREQQQIIVNDASVDIVVGAGEAVIRRHFGPEAKGFSGETFTSFHVTIEAPPGINVDIKTKFGDVRIDGTFGDLDVDLRAGEIDARLPHASVRELRASCRVGEVRTTIRDEIIEREGLFPGRTRFVNPDGKSMVTLHVTAGEVRVALTP